MGPMYYSSQAKDQLLRKRQRRQNPCRRVDSCHTLRSGLLDEWASLPRSGFLSRFAKFTIDEYGVNRGLATA